MKLKNKDIKSVVEALFFIGNRMENISDRWEVALISEPFANCDKLLSNEVNKLVQEQGVEDKNGNKTLPVTNEDYIKLLECESEISFEPLTLERLDKYRLDTSDLLLLKPIIKAGG